MLRRWTISTAQKYPFICLRATKLKPPLGVRLPLFIEGRASGTPVRCSNVWAALISRGNAHRPKERFKFCRHIGALQQSRHSTLKKWKPPQKIIVAENRALLAYFRHLTLFVNVSTPIGQKRVCRRHFKFNLLTFTCPTRLMPRCREHCEPLQIFFKKDNMKKKNSAVESLNNVKSENSFCRMNPPLVKNIPLQGGQTENLKRSEAPPLFIPLNTGEEELLEESEGILALVRDYLPAPPTPAWLKAWADQLPHRDPK